MLLQMVKFGFVGLSATAIHTAMLLFLVEKLGVGPLISFLLQRYWTFSGSNQGILEK